MELGGHCFIWRNHSSNHCNYCASLMCILCDFDITILKYSSKLAKSIKIIKSKSQLSIDSQIFLICGIEHLTDGH